MHTYIIYHWGSTWNIFVFVFTAQTLSTFYAMGEPESAHKLLRSKIANGNVKRTRTVVICRVCEWVPVCLCVCECGGCRWLCCSIGACPCEWIGGKNKFDNCTRATNEMNKTKMKRHFSRRRCCCAATAAAGVFDGFLWWYSSQREKFEFARAISTEWESR